MYKGVILIKYLFITLCFVVSLTANDDGRLKGEKIFKLKGCVMCHKKDDKNIGPSLSLIYKRYSGKESKLVDFFKGNSHAIIDPGRASMMRAQLTKIRGLNDISKKHLARYLVTINDREF